MPDCSQIRSMVEPGAEPITDKSIVAIQIALGLNFPPDYLELLQCVNGFTAQQDTSSLLFYSLDELQERNETYQVQQTSPALLLIGDDGGGRGILLEHGKNNSPIYLIGLGSLAIEDGKILASSLAEWVEKNLSLGD